MNFADRFMVTTYFMFLLLFVSTISETAIKWGALVLIFIISLGFSVAWEIWGRMANE